MRPFKVHYVASHRTLCKTPLQYNAAPERTTPYVGETTCLVCLYHLGLYVPLSKLWDHQSAMQGYFNWQKEHMTADNWQRCGFLPHTRGNS